MRAGLRCFELCCSVLGSLAIFADCFPHCFSFFFSLEHLVIILAQIQPAECLVVGVAMLWLRWGGPKMGHVPFHQVYLGRGPMLVRSWCECAFFFTYRIFDLYIKLVNIDRQWFEFLHDPFNKTHVSYIYIYSAHVSICLRSHVTLMVLVNHSIRW